MSYTLSYIVSTRNRIQFLQIILPLLFANIQPDEEIIVVDSNSTDGTQDYLNELHSKGKIHKFISEPDKNQAHGWNKAILMAEGEIIKKIIDDDLFCFSAIQKCKNYMLTNKSIDVCIPNTMKSGLSLSTNLYSCATQNRISFRPISKSNPLVNLILICFFIGK